MNDLNLTIKADKTEYSLDEPITILATLSNHSGDSILINDRFLFAYEDDDDKECYFQVVDSKNERFDNIENRQADISPIPLRENNMRKLAPNEHIEQSINFSLLFKLKKGEYKVVGKYKSTPYKNWKGIYEKTITSDTITIVIK